MRRHTFVLSLFLVLAVVLTACGGRPQETRLRMGLLPILDILPFHIADQRGYFEEQGIQVELVPVKSAQERDALMQAGEIDGMLTDLISIGLFNREQVQIQVVAIARRAYPDAPQFRILAAPGSGIQTVQDLAGVPIGISQNTIIEYLTDRLLTASGLSPDQIAIQEVSAIPVRFEQLMNGQIQAATLPDPLAQGAIAGGAHLIVDDSRYTQYSQSVLAFHVKALKEKPDTVRKFMVAWNKAVAELNANPEAYEDLLIEVGRVPPSIQGTYKMPLFPQGEITSEGEWEDVVNWLLEKGLIEKPIPYSDAVSPDFVATK